MKIGLHEMVDGGYIPPHDELSLVSVDFNHASESSTFASQQTKVLPSGMTRILSWYDNEWGFSNRMADTAVAMGKLI